MHSTFFQKYLLPGFIFQSLVIAGGYGTGRELVEFFLDLGPLTGLLAMGVATAIWSAVAASSFELARLTRSYDYRTFFIHLLGRGWFLYEILYFLTAFLVLSVTAFPILFPRDLATKAARGIISIAKNASFQFW